MKLRLFRPPTSTRQLVVPELGKAGVVLITDLITLLCVIGLIHISVVPWASLRSFMYFISLFPLQQPSV